MLTIRKAKDRGHANHGWLDTYHTFSFADYYDPRNMGFRSLRVINEDRVAPAEGFGMHGHRDMEIITYIVEGALEHRDSIGTGSVIRPGDVQRMSAGTGVRHSEFNHSKDSPVHLLQIWILPEREGVLPSYEEKRFDENEKRGKLRLVASRDGREGSVMMHQDASLYATILDPGQEISHRLSSGRGAWVQIVRGKLELNGKTLEAGDGAALSDEEKLSLRAIEKTEALVFDLA